MESNVSKYYALKFFITIVGYFVGMNLFIFFNVEALFSRLMAGLAGAILFWVLSDIVYFNHQGKLKMHIKIEAHDERNQMIEAKVLKATYLLTIITLFMAVFVAGYFDNLLMSYSSAVLAIVIIGFNQVAKALLNKKY